MRYTTKSNGWWLIAVGVILIFGASAGAQTASGLGGCSNRTLSGDYGTLIEGVFVAANWPLRTISMMHFDGAGNVSTSDFVVLNGNPLSDDWTQKTGSYSVKPDCTGTFVLEGVIMTHFAIVNNGKDIRGVTDGDAITFSGSKVR
jgi:hypothetical protein